MRKTLDKILQRIKSFFDASRWGNSSVATEYGRSDTRANIERVIQGFWDAVNVRGRVEKVLRKPSREETAARISEREGKAYERNLRLSRLSKSEGWRIDIVNLLKQWEIFCYMNLRFPENRKDNITVEEYNGFQRGALWVIEGLRKEISTSVNNLQRQNAEKAKQE